MRSEQVGQYGWQSKDPSHTDGYITPKVLSILRRLGVKRVVDLGAGNGALCGIMAAEGLDVSGVELDEAGVRIAQQSHPEISFYNLDLSGSPSELLSQEDPFDVVVSTEVVEHIYSPHRFVQFAHEVLVPGGYFIVSTPYHGYLKNLVLSLLNKWDTHHTALWNGGHIKFWSRKTLSVLLEDEGFEIVEFHGVGRVSYLWKSMILVARKAEKA